MSGVEVGRSTDLDLSVIEHLDFEPPCELTARKGAFQCERPAAWLVTFHIHCGGGTRTQMMCAHHYDYLASGGLWTCRKCDARHVGRDSFIRTERIKP